MTWLPFALLATVLGLATLTDVASRRIPNKLILAGLALGFIWHAVGPMGRWSFDSVNPGAAGLFASFLGATALLVAFFPFYLLRAMGAGDVKLMAVVGAFFGATSEAWTQLFGVTLCVLCAGGVLALVRMLWSRCAGAVLSNVRVILFSYAARLSGTGQMAFDASIQSADRMPYALAIAAGSLFYAVGKWTGWLKFL